MRKLKEKWDTIPTTVKASSAYTICSILERSLSFITLPLFTRLLTTEQYGQTTIFGSWSGVLRLFLTLNLAYGSFNAAMVKYENDRDGYISAIEMICVVLSAAFLLIYLPFRGLWNRLFELPTYLVLVMVGQIIFGMATQLWMTRSRYEFKYKSVVAVTISTALISTVFEFFFVINSSERGYARILAGALLTFLVGGFFFVRSMLKGKKPFNREYWKYALGFNIPLLTYYLSQIIFNQSDRIMISHMVGTDKAGIYGVAYNFAMIMTFVLNAINGSYVPWYYGKIKDGKMRENRTVSLGIAVLMAVLLLGVIWFAPEIIFLMAGKQYAEAVYVVPPVAISMLLHFYTQLFVNVEFYYEEKRKLVWASVGAALTNFVLNWIFIRIFGFVAAAYTTLLSFVIFAYSNYRAMKRVLEEHGVKDEGFNYKGMIMVLLGLVSVSYLGVALYSMLLLRITISVIVFIGIVAKRDYFIGLYRRIRER